MTTCLLILVFLLSAAGPAVAQDEEEKSPPPSAVSRIREKAEALKERIPFEIHGFGEGALGWLPAKNRRIRNHSFNLMEGRIQLKTLYYPERPAILADWGTALSVKTDFVGDGIDEKFRVEFRELNTRFSPVEWLDVKVGRQILTWGTGDLIFVNDLFPKDWVSFFIGRDDEYLKSPSDALKVSAFTKWVNADFVLTPFFKPSKQIHGEYLSFYDPILGRIAGESDTVLHYNEPPQTMNTMEYALRLYRSIESYEFAAYGFKGFYKTSVGVEDPMTGDLFFPRLDAVGWSVRGPVPRLGGIGNLEWAWYNSEENHHGDNPLVENSQLRYLAGYERDLWADFTLGLQYYIEEILDYNRYRLNQPDEAFFSRDQFRQLVTVRLTQLLFQQNATASLFVYFSPTDLDFHFRPRFSWNLTDHWTATVGANVFGGENIYTFFGMFRDDNNLYARLRYSW